MIYLQERCDAMLIKRKQIYPIIELFNRLKNKNFDVETQNKYKIELNGKKCYR